MKRDDMTKRLAVALLLLCGAVGGQTALAQTPADSLKGTWANENAYCGRAVYKIDSVDTQGIVHGTFTCVNTGWTATMGDKVGRDAVKGTLTGNRFVMVNADGGGTDAMLKGDTLEGTGKVKGSSTPNRVIFRKE
jgi:hypothetical protein